MKQTSLIFLFVVSLLSHSFAERKALIIAIGDYPSEGGWPRISSENDVRHIKAALNVLGFSEQNTEVILNEEATKAGIISALERQLNSTEQGDIIYIHFSGHGQQVVDDNGDEIDLLDEAIVPYDSPIHYVDGINNGEKLIRDDLMGEFISKIRNKAGKEGMVILMMDSCHSGSGLRGLGIQRGSDIIMGPKEIIAVPENDTLSNYDLNMSSSDNLSPLASFYGSSSHQLNSETLDQQYKSVGSLSFAFASIISSLGREIEMTELFERIKLKMKFLAPNQTPVFEGEGDLTFGAKTTDDNRLYEINEFLSNEKLVGSFGSFNEIYEGSRVEVFSIDQNKSILEGEVTMANLFESTITLDSILEIKNDELLKLRIKETAISKISISICDLIPDDSQWKNIINEICQQSFIIPLEKNADLTILQSDNRLQLISRENHILYDSDFTNESKHRYNLDKLIKQITQGKFLKNYEHDNSGLNLVLGIDVIDCDEGNVISTFEFDNINIPEVSIDQCVRLRVLNNAQRPAYFTLLDIQPDHQINILIPYPRQKYTPDEFYLEPGKSYQSSIKIKIGEPLGLETLKLIASKSSIDLANILANQGTTDRGIAELNPFEQIFSLSFQNEESRGIKIVKPDIEEIGIKNYFFKIKE